MPTQSRLRRTVFRHALSLLLFPICVEQSSVRGRMERAALNFCRVRLRANQQPVGTIDAPPRMLHPTCPHPRFSDRLMMVGLASDLQLATAPRQWRVGAHPPASGLRELVDDGPARLWRGLLHCPCIRLTRLVLMKEVTDGRRRYPHGQFRYRGGTPERRTDVALSLSQSCDPSPSVGT